MKVLVTGDRGFIGSALTLELRQRGHEVVGFDVKSSLEQDVNYTASLYQSIAREQPNVLVHLAAEVGKLNCENNSGLALRANVEGTLNVARACASYCVPLVYCSTSEVYGDQKEEVVSEDHRNSTGYGMSGVYGLTKRWGEEVCELYAPNGLKIVRPTMPYGPGVPPGPGRRALDNLIWQALTGQPMVVHRGASRSWCWIGDLARGFAYVIERGGLGVYNVGRDDDEVSMRALAWKILEHTNGRLDLIQAVDPPPRQTPVKRISCARLRGLGWKPEVSLDEGLPKMVEWIQGWIESGQSPALARSPRT